MKLWIDDIRDMPADFDVWAKNYEEAVSALKTGKVTQVSFDHDLGDARAFTGYDIARWIEEQSYLGNFKKVSWDIHSANPVGRKNIEAAMNNAAKWWI